MRDTFEEASQPVVSVDAKHRELVGDFKHYRTTWEQDAILVLDHDFPFDAKGVALSYGVYDVAANHARVSVNTSHDTPDFAVDNLVKWLAYHGLHRYPGATELLALADSGASTGARGMQARPPHRLCDRYGLSVTVYHYPSCASK